MRKSAAWLALGGMFSLLVTAWIFQDLSTCPGDCFVDYAAYHGTIAPVETQDARLNSWILAWVKHSLLHESGALFDGNTFYPAKNGLTGSEHLIGMALQTWPFDLVFDSAVAVHQSGLVLATVLLGWTTFTLTFYLTGTPSASLLAAFASMFMPWRWMEFGHLQLLSAQWFPLVWLLFGEALRGALSRGALVLLAAALSLQLLTSFYLAYFLTFSLAILGVAFVLSRQVTMRGVLTTAVACAVPYGVFMLASSPYLLREAGDGLDIQVAVRSLPWDFVLDSLRPQVLLAAEGISRRAPDYSIPGVVLVLALAAPWFLRRLPDSVAARRAWPYVYGLLAVAVVSAVLCMGWVNEIGGKQVMMPGGWAALFVPGYEHLRSPLRWAIVIGLALPPLAGVALAGLAELCRRGPAPRLLAALPSFIAAVLVLVAANPSARLPMKPAWTAEERRPYERLAELPDGVVVSLPWVDKLAGGPEWESRYALLSTLHWKRTLNGFTAYRPPVYGYLLDLAEGLPDSARIESLVRFADLRWIVRHRQVYDPDAGHWERLVSDGVLRIAYDEAGATIYEVMSREESGSWRSTLRESAPRPQTVTGLSREPLNSGTPGTLDVAMRENYAYLGIYGLPQPVTLDLVNGGDRIWAGLDPDPEGLVHLRAVFRNEAGSVVARDLSPLYVDVPARGAARTKVNVRGPGRKGRYGVVFHLVQIVDGKEIPLDVAPVVSTVFAHPMQGG